MDSISEIYNPFEEMTFTQDRCFMCGEKLNNKNKSVEHIFPKWLQNEFDLWEQKLILLNKTEIFYKNLVIPCCTNCNNEHLNKKIEKKIEVAVKGGYNEFIKLDEITIFKWLVKLTYGMLFKELSLKLDIKDKSKGTILSEEELKKFKMLFLFLQSIRFETEFKGEKPWSLMIFRIHRKENEKKYNGMDIISSLNYFFTLNDIGIISCLQDNGTQKKMFDEHFSHFYDKELNEIQFRELCAKVCYKSLLMKKMPFYIFCLPRKDNKKMWILSFEMTGEIYDKWEQKKYAEILSFFLKPFGIEFSDIFLNDEQVITFLTNEDGNFKEMNHLEI